VVCIRRRPDAVDLPGGVVVDTDLGRDWKGWRSP